MYKNLHNKQNVYIFDFQYKKLFNNWEQII
jgi:hypothetical protein